MLVDLVQVTTRDGVRLHGALELPSTQATNPLVDAWLCIHGTGSNFYAASTLAGLVPSLLAGGAAVLRINTRGHDLLCTGPSALGRSWQGAAFERVDEAGIDLAAWLELLAARGFRHIGVLGHSLGAVKAIYTLAGENPPALAALVAVSPPRLSYGEFCRSPRGDEFRRSFDHAQLLVNEGRGDELLLIKVPLAYYVSAAGYVDRYGPDEKYNILKLLDRVSCPTLVTYGSREVQADVAFQGMPEAVARCATPGNSLQVVPIAGADHLYTGVLDTLAASIDRWLARRAKQGARG